MWDLAALGMSDYVSHVALDMGMMILTCLVVPVFFLVFDVCSLHQGRHSLGIVDVLHHTHTQVVSAT